MADTTEILADLTPEQIAAVTHVDGPLLVLAGAGSGKTRTITRRVAYLVAAGIAPFNILAVTFTNKAAGEMRQRIGELLSFLPGRQRAGVTVATFHSLCAKLLREFAPHAGLDSNFNIIDSSDQTKMAKLALEHAGISAELLPPARLLSAISQSKNRLQQASQFAAHHTDFASRNIARAFAAYEQLMKENKAVDFDDLLLRMAMLLRDNTEIRERLQDRFQYILIDEYQDTNHAQFIICHMLALKHQNICATGDPDQSIYGWRGANLGNILDFEQHFPNAKIVRLEQNYRSTKTILKAASALIANNLQRKNKSLWTNNEQGARIKILYAADEREEARNVARQLREMFDQHKMRWDEMAVLYRINSLSRVLEDALMEAAIPYQIVRGTEFYARKEVKDALAYLRLLINPSDRVSFERIINVPTRGIGPGSMDRIIAYAQENRLNLLEACAQAQQIDGLTKKASSAARVFGHQMELCRTEFAHLLRTAPVLPASDSPPDASADGADEAELAVPDFADDLRADQLFFVSDDNEDTAGDPHRGSEPGQESDFESEAQSEIPARSNTSLRGVAALMDRMLRIFKLIDHDKRDAEEVDRINNLLELINVAAEFTSQNPDGTLAEYLEQVTLVSDVDKLDDERGSVTLMTLHAAKGLEFPLVIMIGLEEGTLPMSRSFGKSGRDDSDMEEERRLAFVGMTRAKKRLILTGALSRMTRGFGEGRTPSRFVSELPKDCIELFDAFRQPRPAGSPGYRDNLQYHPKRPQGLPSERSISDGGSPVADAKFRRGVLVRHPMFGVGRVEDYIENGESSRAVIEFRKVGRKTLVLAFAKLELIGGDA
jgi:DNA helicase-2/ATP-dependent DNA helicase PcrA